MPHVKPDKPWPVSAGPQPGYDRTMLALTLKETAALTNRIAAANGFDHPNWDNIIIKLALAGGELDEARDGAMGVGEDPIEEELADAAIRILSVLDSIWGEDWCDRVTTRHQKKISPFAPIEVLLWPTLGYLFKAMEMRRYDNRAETKTCIELALLEVFRLADALQINLMHAIWLKCEKNKGRPKLHGKGYAVG